MGHSDKVEILNPVIVAVRKCRTDHVHFWTYNRRPVVRLKRRKLAPGINLKNCIAPEIEERVVALAVDEPAWGQKRAAELENVYK